MKVIYLFFISFFCVLPIGNTQAGIQFMGGLTIADNSDINITPEGTKHPGYYFAADAALNEGKMFFIVGLQYQKLAFEAQTSNDFFSHDPSMSWFNLRVGLGFQVIRFSDSAILHTKTLGTINTLLSYPSNFFAEPYDVFNKNTAGVLFGLGLDLSNFSIEIEYNKGFFKAVNKVDDTQFDFVNFGIGYRI